MRSSLAPRSKAWATWNARSRSIRLIVDYRVARANALARVADEELQSLAASGGGPDAQTRAQSAVQAADDAYRAVADVFPAALAAHLGRAELNNRAAYYLGSQFAQIGLEASDEALAIRPRSADARYQRAIALSLLGDAEQARDDAATAAAVDGRFAEPLILEGELAEKAGDWSAALAAFEQALAVLPPDSALRAQLDQRARSVEASLSAQP